MSNDNNNSDLVFLALAAGFVATMAWTSGKSGEDHAETDNIVASARLKIEQAIGELKSSNSVLTEFAIRAESGSISSAECNLLTSLDDAARDVSNGTRDIVDKLISSGAVAHTESQSYAVRIGTTYDAISQRVQKIKPICEALFPPVTVTADQPIEDVRMQLMLDELKNSGMNPR